LTESCSVRIAAADLIDGDDATPLGPFELHRSRAAIARSLAGARGEPLRYPGVICSREGQELVVESWAPELVTS
jgi:hypothetical protein